jgi:tetratricopeptide (TPR) repeat protein
MRLDGPGVSAVLLLSCALATDTVAAQSQEKALRVVRLWIAAAQQHHPGEIDPPLLEVARETPADIDLLLRTIRSALKALFASDDQRNDVLRRGAMLHTDIALLLPQQAAEFTLDDLRAPINPFSDKWPVRRDSDALVFALDGEYRATATDSAHWWMARTLLDGILPHPSTDPFVAAWYRAVAAGFEQVAAFGSAQRHLEHALDVLPNDPLLCFYSATLHEAYASPGIQSVPLTRPGLARMINLPPPSNEWRLAERRFRESIEANGPEEAQVRLGRVLGHLGKHADAAAVLRNVMPQLADRRLQYLGALFLGSEESALKHVDQARESLEKAASLYPTAQSPLLALSALYRLTGDRTAARQAIARLEALPADPYQRDDPWSAYQRSFAADAADQIQKVRAAVGGGSRP